MSVTLPDNPPRQAVTNLRERLTLEILQPVAGLIPGFQPTGTLKDFLESLAKMGDIGRDPNTWGGVKINERILMTALLDERLHVARSIEHQRTNTDNALVIEALEAKLRPFHELLKADCFKRWGPAALPRLSDYLTTKAIEETRPTRMSDRFFDEKFGILHAPTLLTQDLASLRGFCALRGTSLCVAFLDIDNLKDLNSKLTETVVDRIVLPQFMRAVESAVYQHGLAYRMGGDEYFVIIPNADLALGKLVANRIRHHVAERFSKSGPTVTASFGMCLVETDNFLTEQEIYFASNKAKNFAKAQGKDRIGYTLLASGTYLVPESLSILEGPA